MDTYDFLTTYLPSASELDATRIQEMRTSLATLIAAAGSDVDTSPNSPFGDLVLSPMATGMAANEEAWNRLLSDLNPENAAAGVVYNCDFVERYLTAFGLYDASLHASWGILRLVFQTTEDREIDKSTVFLINDVEFLMHLPFDGPLLLTTGSPTAETNHKPYVVESNDRYVVDVLVTGTAGTTIEAGAAASSDRDIDGLYDAVLLSAVEAGSAPLRIQELARRVVTNSHSRHPVTRGGAANMIRQRFPEVNTVSPVLSGDDEMARDAVNPGQVAAGCMDIHVRSDTLLEDTITVALPMMAGPAGEDSVFAGLVEFPETPVLIDSLLATDGSPYSWMSFSVSEDAAMPRLAAAYSSSEQLLVKVVAGTSPPATVLIDGELHAWFTITYRFDPALKACQELLEGPDYQAAGLRIAVRWFLPVLVDSFEVHYHRKAGVSFSRESAHAEIVEAFNRHHFDGPASASTVSDALYYAGAHSMQALTLTARVLFSPADMVWAGSTFAMPTNQATWDAFLLECESVPSHTVNDPYIPSFDLDLRSENLYAASGDRNVSWLLDGENLNLVEDRSV